VPLSVDDAMITVKIMGDMHSGRAGVRKVEGRPLCL